jgi:hypothetical protein
MPFLMVTGAVGAKAAMWTTGPGMAAGMCHSINQDVHINHIRTEPARALEHRYRAAADPIRHRAHAVAGDPASDASRLRRLPLRRGCGCGCGCGSGSGSGFGFGFGFGLALGLGFGLGSGSA